MCSGQLFAVLSRSTKYPLTDHRANVSMKCFRNRGKVSMMEEPAWLFTP